MRPRATEILTFFAVVVIVAMILTCLFLVFIPRPATTPAMTLTVVSYTNAVIIATNTPRNWICAEVTLKNTGTASICYRPSLGNPYPVVKAQTPLGWETNYQGGTCASPLVLPPGASDTFPIWLPTNAIRWQLFCLNYHTATIGNRSPAASYLLDTYLDGHAGRRNSILINQFARIFSKVRCLKFRAIVLWYRTTMGRIQMPRNE
jgi:hypothetical protein